MTPSVPVADDQLRIVPANEATCEDLTAIFGTTDYAGRCHCQRFKVVGWIWRDSKQDERTAMSDNRSPRPSWPGGCSHVLLVRAPVDDKQRRELLVSGEVFDRRARSLFDSVTEDDEDDVREEMFALLRDLVATGLTERQRLIVQLTYDEQLTQAEVAARLGISQQVVSKQLFGVVRDGKRIGGAIRRLRQLCEEHGLDPERWV